MRTRPLDRRFAVRLLMTTKVLSILWASRPRAWKAEEYREKIFRRIFLRIEIIFGSAEEAYVFSQNFLPFIR